jgi:sugar O-acyltransferase (sialic acid O-acetyltransferase NeuD family)
MHRLILPTLGVNDQDALIIWRAEEREPVRRGQIIASAETTKTTFDVEAETDGYLYRLAPDSERVAVGAVFGVIHEQSEVSPETVQSWSAPSVQVAGRPKEKRATAKARLLAESRGVDLDEIASSGPTIQESDVRAYLATHGANGASGPPIAAPAPATSRLYAATERTRVLVVGGAGGGTQVLDMLARLPDMNAVGAVDNNADLIGSKLLGVTVLGSVADIPKLWADQVFDAAVVAIVSDRSYRRQVFDQLTSWSIPLVNVIDPTASIRFGVQLGRGNVIRAFCHIAAHTVIGDNNYFADYVNIEHQNRIGSHCTFGPFVSTSGLVQIGDYAKFGTGVFLEPRVKVGKGSVIGSGVVLVGDVPDESLVKTKANYTISPLPASMVWAPDSD